MLFWLYLLHITVCRVGILWAFGIFFIFYILYVFVVLKYIGNVGVFICFITLSSTRISASSPTLVFSGMFFKILDCLLRITQVGKWFPSGIIFWIVLPLNKVFRPCTMS